MNKYVYEYHRKSGGSVFRAYWNKPSGGRIYLGVADTREEAEKIYDHYVATGEKGITRARSTDRRGWVATRERTLGRKVYELYGCEPGVLNPRYMAVFENRADCEKALEEFLKHGVYPTRGRATRARVAPSPRKPKPKPSTKITGPNISSHSWHASADRIAMMKAIYARIG